MNSTLAAIVLALAMIGAYALLRIVVLEMPENCEQVN